MITFDRFSHLMEYFTDTETNYSIPEWARAEHLEWIFPLSEIWRCEK